MAKINPWNSVAPNEFSYLESGPPAKWFDKRSVESAIVDQSIRCQIEVGNEGRDEVQLC